MNTDISQKGLESRFVRHKTATAPTAWPARPAR